jgi:hypothetical protein
LMAALIGTTTKVLILRGSAIVPKGVRFAPTPTGRFRLGHAFAAKVVWELARAGHDACAGAGAGPASRR